jgi:hypothetical protein
MASVYPNAAIASRHDQMLPVVCRILASLSHSWLVCVFSPVGWLQYSGSSSDVQYLWRTSLFYACRLFAIYVLLIFAFVPCLLRIVVYQHGQSRISGERQRELPEAVLTGNHVTVSGPDQKWRQLYDRKSGHESNRVPMRNRFPRFFLTIVVIQNVPLHMTDTATGLTEGHLTLKGRVCAYATENCAISALVRPFDRKWRHQTSPVGLPLELEVTGPKSVLGVLTRASTS